MLLLLFFLFILVVILVLVGLSQIAPRMMNRSSAEVEQDIEGIGPESAKVGGDPDLTG